MQDLHLPSKHKKRWENLSRHSKWWMGHWVYNSLIDALTSRFIIKSKFWKSKPRRTCNRLLQRKLGRKGFKENTRVCSIILIKFFVHNDCAGRSFQRGSINFVNSWIISFVPYSLSKNKGFIMSVVSVACILDYSFDHIRLFI